MGLLRQYMQGNSHTYRLTNFSSALHAYHSWWYSEFKMYVVEGLSNMLMLKDDESSSILDIQKFRRDFSLMVHDEITQNDIIRFKTLAIYKWLFLDMQKRLEPLFSPNEIKILTNIIECSVLVATDAVTYFEDITDNIDMYNLYIQRVIESLMNRFDTCRLELRELKKKYFAAIMIQRQWRTSNTNPTYQICKTRLEREYNELCFV